MNLQLIRNATLRLHYGGQLLLIDPYFAPKHSLPSYAQKSNNPLVDLPLSIDEITQDVDALIVSHLHTDHFDSVAKERLEKDLPLFCQPTNDTAIREGGFRDVRVLETVTDWHGVTITRTDGRHGEGDTAQLMGKVSGFVFQAEGEPTIYWCGDTVWYETVQQVIDAYQPDIIVTHSCGAVWGDDPRPIVMDAEQTVALCQYAPQSKVIAVHMEALDHATVSRADLRAYADEQGISTDRLLIPADGDMIEG